MRTRHIVGAAVLGAGVGAVVMLGLGSPPPAHANPYVGGVTVPPLDPGILPACEVEDASSGPIPCAWDAGSAGNGRGHSFWVGRPTPQDPDRRPIFHYLDPRDDAKWGGR